MTETTEDIDVISPRTEAKKKYRIKRIDFAITNDPETNRLPATRISRIRRKKIHFEKWIMPPEPEGYIKCREFDFL